MQKLCSGDWDRTLKFSVYDWNRLVILKLFAHKIVRIVYVNSVLLYNCLAAVPFSLLFTVC